jgi:hypothetical protein
MKKAIEIQAPNDLINKIGYIKVFLAGSIEMGKAEDWQKKIVKTLSDKPFIFLNPRRNDWDSSWEQTIENPEFKLQVTWELTGLEMADVIVMYFDPETKSPISLLELGLHARTKKLIVVCPEGFWRKGNVDVVCEKYGITQANSIDELIENLQDLV